jgi:hypothetical protein
VPRGFLILPCALGLALALGGCGKKQPGEPCKPGDVACADKATGLFCQGAKYVVMTCSGPLGCAPGGSNQVECDNSLAKEGDGCNQPDDVACASDRRSALQCKNGKFALAATCKGPKNCQLKDNKIFCDNDLSDLGDPCHEDGDFACTTDAKTLMQCKGGKFADINTCRGPKACTVHEHPEENKIGFACDDSIADANDPCDENGEEACSLDKRSLEQCKNGHFVFVRNCHGPGGCSYDDRSDKFACDTHGK